MCGINGILSSSSADVILEKVRAMNNCLRHRGPDDEGTQLFEPSPGTNLVFGHRRLSIIDLSAAGHQPMTSYDGRYSIIFNGELYNYKELKFDLQRAVSGAGEMPYPFKTNSDTEVILAAFTRWGIGALERMNGMFGFALWDENEKELLLVRDRLGIKPVYYYHGNGNFVFSSELRAVLSSGMADRKLNTEALQDYLAYQTVHAPATIIENVKMLLPGHYMRVKNNELTIKAWWTPSLKQAGVDADTDYSHVKKKVRELFFEAVKSRLVADVPFGAFLSGGIDSSAVVAVMSKVGDQRVKTFSVIFDDPEFSENRYSRLIAGKYNTDHHTILLKPEDMLNELPAALAAMDHPGGDGPNTYIVSKATKNAGITMALSGIGGDELFGGYELFRRSLRIEEMFLLKAIPSFLRKPLGKLFALAKGGIAGDKLEALLATENLELKEYYPLFRQVLNAGEVKKLLGATPHMNEVMRIAASFSPAKKNSVISRVTICEINTYLQNVLLRDTDQMSMAHALEVREPFLDYRLVEYVLSLPDSVKIPVTPKKLFVDAMGDLLPMEIVNRSKMGFTFPWKNWMKGELKKFCEEQLQYLGSSGIMDKNALSALWERFMNDDPRVTWSRVWPLITLGAWLKLNKVHG